MSYTIVGMFATNEDADNASEKLHHSGFQKEDFQVSRFSVTGDAENSTDNYHFEEDEKTTGFWNWLFGEDEEEKKKYSFAGTKSNLVTVYANDIESAEKAREIMNDQGAINVDKLSKTRYRGVESETESADISSEERSRIIAKAKNNLYLTDDTRYYRTRNEGMESDMDSQGIRDTF